MSFAFLHLLCVLQSSNCSAPESRRSAADIRRRETLDCGLQRVGALSRDCLSAFVRGRISAGGVHQELQDAHHQGQPSVVCCQLTPSFLQTDPSHRCAALLAYGTRLVIIPFNDGQPRLRSYTVPLKKIDTRLGIFFFFFFFLHNCECSVSITLLTWCFWTATTSQLSFSSTSLCRQLLEGEFYFIFFSQTHQLVPFAEQPFATTRAA